MTPRKRPLGLVPTDPQAAAVRLARRAGAAARCWSSSVRWAWTIPPQTDQRARRAAATRRRSHPLGTDELGRDELSRLLHGGQVTLLVGFAAMFTSIVLGLLVGAIAGFYSGWLDVILMRVTDTMTGARRSS